MALVLLPTYRFAVWSRPGHEEGAAVTPIHRSVLTALPADAFEAGLLVLRTPDAYDKAHATLQLYEAFCDDRLPLPQLPIPRSHIDACVPSEPARTPDRPIEGLKAKGTKVTIHGIAHAEHYAISLMWDLMVRFAYEECLETDFWAQFLEIAAQEASHFLSWAGRLEAMGMRYGDLRGTETLWSCASATADDVMARLALVNLVHEARGLDTFEASIKRLERAGDHDSAAVLRHNVQEEIGHVAAGVRWFKRMCEHRGVVCTPPEKFHEYVRTRYAGAIRPPFNVEYRSRAGMTREWYEPLVTPVGE